MQEYCKGMTIKDKDHHTVSETSVPSVYLQLNALFPTVPTQDNYDRQDYFSCFPRTLKFEAMLLTTATRRSATEIHKNH